MLRWIDEVNGIKDLDNQVCGIKSEISELKNRKDHFKNRREIKRLHDELDQLLFVPDYLLLVIDKVSNYKRACKGFEINGMKYRRIFGTNGGIKNSTIVFLSERVIDEIRTRVENGRNPDKQMVAAKLEAYKALTCSASIPVSKPNGVLVVNDAETNFFDEVIHINDQSGDPDIELEQPIVSEPMLSEININASDGFGLMLPTLSKRWSTELGCDYIVSGFNTRYAFEKGMVFTFDFLEFADRVAKKYIVKDAWGDDVDIRNVELILTTSMVKLWDSYGSSSEYFSKSDSNGYEFCISKISPESLENERHLNYQFIQSYDLSDDDIMSLVEPTVQEFKDVLSGDWRKSVLFLKGFDLSERNISRQTDDYIKAMMIDQRVFEDPWVKTSIQQMVKNKINKAKVGVLKVRGNYSIISGDPFLLCESIFGLEKKGLLKSGEIYNKYWADSNADKLACFRAPMTSMNNIRLVKSNNSDEVKYWFRYITSCTVLNAWDTITMALNGCDFDGDIALLTDNEVLVRNLKQLPALSCVQRIAKKSVPTEADFIKSNIDSFGNEIGRTTNYITSMFERRACYPEDSEEYKELSYRIKCGQLYQQNAIKHWSPYTVMYMTNTVNP